MAESRPPELPLAAIRDLLRWLKAAQVQGVVIGGVAVSIQGHARYTRDLDALVVVPHAKWPKFMGRAAEFGFVGRVPDVLGFASQSRMLLLVHEPSVIAVDISLGTLEFEEELIGRATIVKLGRLKVPVAGPEDLIILKAIAMRPRDLGDIDSILQAQPRLDHTRIRRTVAKFAGLLEQPEIVEQLESLLKRHKKRGKEVVRMLGTVAPTPYDLRFSLFGIPVRVHPFFWLFMAIMGWGEGDLKLVLLWVACAFVSILIHELGHAWTAKSYGWPPNIVLYAFGGYASYQPTWGHTTGKTILVLLAGPGAGFIFYAFILAFEKLLTYQGIQLTDMAIDVISDLKWINLGWGVINLLPVYPLDGGQISHAALSHFFPRSGGDTSLKISIVFAVGIAALAFYAHQTYTVLLFGSLAFENFQMLQGPRYR